MEIAAMMNFKRKPHGEEVETNDESDDRRRSWHIDRAINLPFILALMVVMGSAYVYVETQNERRVKTEAAVEQTKIDLRELKVDVKDNAVKLDVINGNQKVVMATLDRIERKR
jgi:hypothetical protein